MFKKLIESIEVKLTQPETHGVDQSGVPKGYFATVDGLVVQDCKQNRWENKRSYRQMGYQTIYELESEITE